MWTTALSVYHYFHKVLVSTPIRRHKVCAILYIAATFNAFGLKVHFRLQYSRTIFVPFFQRFFTVPCSEGLQLVVSKVEHSELPMSSQQRDTLVCQAVVGHVELLQAAAAVLR